MQQLKLDAFLDYRFLSGLQFAPGGKQAAFVVSAADREKNSYSADIYLYRGGDTMKLTGDGKAGSYVWESDTDILFPAGRSDADKEQLKNGDCTLYYRISTLGGEAQPAFKLPFAGALVKRFEGTCWLASGSINPLCPDYYLLTEEQKAEERKKQQAEADYEVFTNIPFYENGSGFRRGQVGALFLVDTAGGTAKRISSPEQNAWQAVTLGGKVYYTGEPAEKVAKYDGSEIYVYDPATGESRMLTKTPGFMVYFIEVVGDRLIACGGETCGREIDPEQSFYTVDLETGALSLLAENTDSIFNSTGSDCRYGGCSQFAAAGDKLYFVKTVRNAAGLYCLNPDGSVVPVLEREGSVDDFAVAEDGSVLVNGLFGTALEELYTVAEGKETRVSSFNTSVLKDTYTADYRKLTVESRGWDIDGWVLLPKDYDETKRYPAILDIHGGPRTVYGELFYHEMQLWASMGYFVFFCNPVGSSGRGREFADLTNAYGSIDYENLMDFTDAVLAAYPQIDPARVGCTGGSYGGYMSNWILGHTDRFAAIATQRSISNWISFYGVSDIGYLFVPNQHGQDIYSEAGLKRLWELSPLAYINNMKTPTLFIHSDEDYRCPMEQGMQLYTALTEKGIPSRFVYFKGENHDLSRTGKPLHRVKRLQEITDWMEKYVRGNTD